MPTNHVVLDVNLSIDTRPRNDYGAKSGIGLHGVLVGLGNQNHQSGMLMWWASERRLAGMSINLVTRFDEEMRGSIDLVYPALRNPRRQARAVRRDKRSARPCSSPQVQHQQFNIHTHTRTSPRKRTKNVSNPTPTPFQPNLLRLTNKRHHTPATLLNPLTPKRIRLPPYINIPLRRSHHRRHNTGYAPRKRHQRPHGPASRGSTSRKHCIHQGRQSR